MIQQKPAFLIQISLDELVETIQKAINDSLRENQIAILPKSDDDLLTRNETAKMLRVTLPTLHDWTKRGYLQSYRISSRIRYKRSEVNNAFASGQLHKYGRAF